MGVLFRILFDLLFVFVGFCWGYKNGYKHAEKDYYEESTDPCETCNVDYLSPSCRENCPFESKEEKHEQ